MKNLFKKTAKKTATKATAISKSELKNIVGGMDTTPTESGVKIASEKTGTFFHS